MERCTMSCIDGGKHMKFDVYNERIGYIFDSSNPVSFQSWVDNDLPFSWKICGLETLLEGLWVGWAPSNEEMLDFMLRAHSFHC